MAAVDAASTMHKRQSAVCTKVSTTACISVWPILTTSEQDRSAQDELRNGHLKSESAATKRPTLEMPALLYLLRSL